MLDHMNSTSLCFYQPHENVAVDERMVKSKARFSFQQYIKNKPVRRGFKLWCLCDSKNGYTCRVQVYRGKEGEQRSSNGLSYDVVTSLLEGFDGQGYKLFCDNFYTSPTLFRHLISIGVNACGTATVNRKEFPPVLKPYVKKFKKKSVERGEGCWFRDGRVVHVLWRDTKVVCLSSSFQHATGMDKVERKIKGPGGLVVKMVPAPPAVIDYNQFMGGVDMSDQCIGYYNLLHKTRKYWKTLFFHFLDIMITNSYILYKLHLDPDLQDQFTHKDFREQLAIELCGPTEDEEERFLSPQSRSHVRAPHQLSFVSRDERKCCDLCKLLKKPVHKTRYKCSRCQMFFCFEPTRNCFRQWHSFQCDHLRSD